MYNSLHLLALSEGPIGPGCLFREDGSIERVAQGYPSICNEIPLYSRPTTYLAAAIILVFAVAMLILLKQRKRR